MLKTHSTFVVVIYVLNNNSFTKNHQSKDDTQGEILYLFRCMGIRILMGLLCFCEIN